AARVAETGRACRVQGHFRVGGGAGATGEGRHGGTSETIATDDLAAGIAAPEPHRDNGRVRTIPSGGAAATRGSGDTTGDDPASASEVRSFPSGGPAHSCCPRQSACPA